MARSAWEWYQQERNTDLLATKGGIRSKHRSRCGGPRRRNRPVKSGPTNLGLFAQALAGLQAVGPAISAPMNGSISALGPTSQSFTSQRLRLNYVDWGNPDAPPLVLVHGGRDHARSWDWTAEALRKDWHVVAMDHRGHGDSDWVSDGNYRTEDMVYDLAQLIHQLGRGPVTIVSHSMGGHVALRYAGSSRYGAKDRGHRGAWPQPQTRGRNARHAVSAAYGRVDREETQGRQPLPPQV